MFDQQVSRGMALLDSVEPGWEQQIDLSLLNLGNPSYCVCGQLFADEAYLAGSANGWAWALGGLLSAGQMADYGFSLEDDESETAEIGDWDDLTLAWAHAIGQRRLGALVDA